jgi:hypothetical protein
MPPLPPNPPRKIRDWGVLITIVGGIFAVLIATFLQRPVSGVILFLLFYLLWFVNRREQCRLANERRGENIGSFARAFDRRSEPFDPWVVRAAWDALQCYTAFPLRPTDRLVSDLHIDPFDIDMVFLAEVAQRSGHMLNDLEGNPYSPRFSSRNATVGDFVKLLSWQPKAEWRACC